MHVCGFVPLPVCAWCLLVYKKMCVWESCLPHAVYVRVCVCLLNPTQWISDVRGAHPLPLIRGVRRCRPLPAPRAQFQIVLMESVLRDCNASETHFPRSLELSAWQDSEEEGMLGRRKGEPRKWEGWWEDEEGEDDEESVCVWLTCVLVGLFLLVRKLLSSFPHATHYGACLYTQRHTFPD